MTDREPIRNLEAERAVLAACLDPDALVGVVDALAPAAFHLTAHQKIFETATDLFRRGQAVDRVTLADGLAARGEPFDGPAMKAFTDLEVSTSANWPHWARIVRDKARLRNFMAGLRAILADGEGGAVEHVPDFMNASAARLLALTADAGDRPADMRTLAGAAWADLETLAEGGPGALGIGTGLPDLDRLTGGLRPGHLWILAARPSFGKTSLALQVALAAALDGTKTVFFTFEQPSDELTKRALIHLARTPAEVLADGSAKRKAEAWRKFTDARTRLEAAALWIEDGQGRTVTGLRARAHRFKVEKGGLGLVVVDYLGLVTPDAARSASREQQVAKISRELKLMAGDLAAPVLALSQLNRKAEDREDGAPRLSDLRDSGAVEQDADLVLLIHRPGKFKKDGDPGEARLNVAKNRHGATGNLELRYLEKIMTFTAPDGGPES